MEERLKKLAALADAGSFTKAAAELHISQPALSAAIAKLERELKARLLVRGARPVTLTRAGDLAYQTAKGLSVQTSNLRLHLAELAGEVVPLHIGMIDSIADAFFDGSAELAITEDVRLSVIVNNSRYLSDAVERGELDFAFVAGRLRTTGLLETLPVADEPLVVVCHPSRRLPGDGVLADFISYDQASNTARLVNRALKGYGVAPQAGFYSTSPEVILRLVLQNKGAAALPYLMVKDYLASKQLKRLGGPNPWLIPRPIIVTRRRDRELPQACQQLTEQLANILRGLMAESLAD